MSKWRDYILSRFILRKARKSQRIMDAAKKCFNKCMKRLGKREKELRRFQVRIESIAGSVVEDLEEAEETVKRMEEAKDAMQRELQIADDVVIPGLVQANKLLLERVTASTTVEVRKQVRNTPRLEE